MIESNVALEATARQIFLICAFSTALLLIGSWIIMARLRPRKGARALEYFTWSVTLVVIGISGGAMLTSALSLSSGLIASFYLLQSVFAVATGGGAVFGLSYLASIFGRLRRELQLSREMREQLQTQRHDLEQLVLARTASLRKEILETQQLRKTVEREHARLDNELRLAAKLQNAVLPQDLSYPGLRVATQFHPMSQTSGDIYDVFEAEDDSVYLFVADAMGHGTAAALLTMMVSAGLRSLDRTLSPAVMLSSLNEVLLKRSTGLYVTAVLARLAPNGGLTVAHAGHPPMLLMRSGDAQALPCRQGGFALGMFDTARMPFVDESFQIQPGDRLLFYTDGLTEAKTGDGTAFGRAGMRAMMAASAVAGHDVTEAAAQLVEAVYDHTETGRLDDDVTVLLVEFTPS